MAKVRKEWLKIDNLESYCQKMEIYGALLTGRMKEVLELYLEEDLSLAEIALELNISRQGVHDHLKRSLLYLDQLEEKLSLWEKENLLSELGKLLEDQKDEEAVSRLRHYLGQNINMTGR